VEARHDRGFSGTAAGGAQARLQLETVAPLMPAGAAAKSVTAGRIRKGAGHSDQLKGMGQIFFFFLLNLQYFHLYNSIFPIYLPPLTISEGGVFEDWSRNSQ
jgi:hypothetical protein